MSVEFLRERVLQALEDRFTSIIEGLPAEAPYTVQYSLVSRTPLTEESWGKLYSLGVHDTSEDEVENADTITNKLNVVLEFRCALSAGDHPSKKGNIVIGELKRRLAEDRQLGGLAIDVQRGRNELYVEEVGQKRLSGAMWLQVIYRHRREQLYAGTV